VFVTCYTGYGVNPQEPGEVAELKRHVLCINRADGSILWNSAVKARMPEPPYRGSMQRHGYASSTPASDGERVYVFFGKSGVFAFDLNGRQIWHADVGPVNHEWGTGASPVVYKDLVIVNASIESESLVALDARSGKEVWRADGMKEAYDTPHFVDVPGGQTELVLAIRDWLLGFDPATGTRLWSCAVPNQHNNNPSAVAHNGVIYCIVSGPARSALAVRAGGRGDVTNSHVLWKVKKGSNVSSPVYHDGYLYFTDDVLGIFYCLDGKTGEIVYQERLASARETYASPVLAEGKLFYVSRRTGTFVLAAKPKFELLAQNHLGDTSIFNASPVVSNGQLLLRSDRFLYCIGNQ
jgi:outer membrane protein assembly factor BamB